MRKAKLILCAIFVFFVTFSKSQNVVNNKTATVIGYWSVGESMRYELTMKKEKFKEGKLVSSYVSTSKVEVTVVDSTGDSYKVHWKYNEVKVTDNLNNPILQQFGRLAEGMTLIYLTDEMGTFTELINWKEIQATVYNTFNEILKVNDSPEARAVMDQLKAIYATRESIEYLVIKEVQLFHMFYGGQYELRKKYVSETNLPNFLGGDSLPAVITVEMTDMKPKKDYCKILFDQNIDKEKAVQIIMEWAQKISGETTVDKSKLPELNIDDKTVGEFELSTGWVINAINSKKVSIDKIKNYDIIEIRSLGDKVRKR